jgi:4-deoxy-L-threo-5-hexosulose-uronate ketol-isomerase
MRFISSSHPDDASAATPAMLRQRFLVSGLFVPGEVSLANWEVDRTVLGGVVPQASPIELPAHPELRAPFFCARRELGIINLGGAGAIEVDGQTHPLAPHDGLYVGRGSQRLVFHSASGDQPAKFYLLSYPAHREFPTRHIAVSDVKGEKLGTVEGANRRILRKYIAPGLVESCQLVMGHTVMEPGGVWNTMPTHTHQRRSEVYCYTGIAPDQAVFHFMGRPDATRHLVVRDLEIMLSPSWSIHSGVGTAPYGFVWGMGGENQDFADMDPVPIRDIR